MAKKEIKIAGAGLAGLTAAINLAKAGYKTTVFEKEKEVAAKRIGDFQYLENWTKVTDILEDIKSMDLEINFWTEVFEKVTVYGPSLKSKFTFVPTSAIAYWVKRGSRGSTIDQGFLKQAKKAGVKIVFNHPLSENQADIVATGASKVGGLGQGCVFKTDHKDCVLVIADDNFSPKGYSYLQVKQGEGVIVAGMATNFEKAEEYLGRTIKCFKKLTSLKIKNPEKFSHPVGLRGPSKKATRNSRIYIGEAAGFQDAFGGFGMRYAIKSGFLAAQSIIKNRDYDKLWQAEFGPLLNTSFVNRVLYEILENRVTLTLLILFLDKRREFIFPLLRWWYKPVWFKTQIYKLFYSFKNTLGLLIFGKRFRKNLIWFPNQE